MVKSIKYNRQNRDFDAFLDGRYIGSFATARDAQAELDRLVYDALTHGAAEVA